MCNGSAPELLERDAELAKARQLLAAAAAANGRALLIVGEGGAGKTALLQVAAELARHAGTDVLLARGSHGERELPFAFAEQALGALADATQANEASGGDSRRSRAAAHRLAHQRLVQRSDAGPLLLALDDLQWADPDSLALIGFLARRLSALRVALIATMRAWPPSALTTARELEVEHVAELIELSPLSEAGGMMLAQRSADERLQQAECERIIRLAAGNPLLTIELARLADRPSGAGQPSADGLRRTVQLRHLAGLSTDAIACAQAASVLARRIEAREVQAVSGCSGEVFARAWDQLIASGVLLVAADGSVEFRHQLLAEAIAADAGPGMLAQLHQRAFAHHLARGDVAAAAAHAREAAAGGDTRASGTLAQAAALALRAGAVETAREQIEAAVELAGPEPGHALAVQRAEILFGCGRSSEAIDAYRQAAETAPDAQERLALLVRAARAQAFAGRFSDARASYDELLAEAGGEAMATPELLLERAHVMWELDGPEVALRELAAADKHDVPVVRAAQALLALQAGDPSGLGELEQIARTARASVLAEPGDALASFNAYLPYASACGYTEQFDALDQIVDDGQTRLLQAGAPSMIPALRLHTIGTLLRRGRLREARTEAEALTRDPALDELLRPSVELYHARALIWMDELVAARELRDRAADSPAANSRFGRLSLALVSGELSLATGDPATAHRCFAALADEAQAIGLREPCIVPWASGAVEAALSCEALDAVDAVANWLELCAEPLPCVWPRLVALGARAALAAAADRREQANALYRQALALPPRLPLERARVALRYGGWLRRSGDPVAAREPLADALGLAGRSGATLLARTAAAELRAAGGRRRRRHEDRDSLTAQEARIAQLAATGATAREIAQTLYLSPRTIESHLARVYAKLGVSGKHELRRRRLQLEVEVEVEVDVDVDVDVDEA